LHSPSPTAGERYRVHIGLAAMLAPGSGIPAAQCGAVDPF
jgi:hypothetical protein